MPRFILGIQTSDARQPDVRWVPRTSRGTTTETTALKMRAGLAHPLKHSGSIRGRCARPEARREA